MRHFVQMSSGLDSLGAVIKTMEKDPGGIYDLFHVIIIHACDNYWQAQLSALFKLIPELRKEYPKAEFNLLPTPSVKYCQAKSLEIIYITQMSCLQLRCSKHQYSSIINGIIDAEYTLEGDWHKSLQMLELFDIKTPFTLPCEFTNKKVIFDSIPSNLAELTWACFFPVKTGDFFEPCGKCYKCRELLKAGIPLNTIDYLNIDSLIEPYKTYDNTIKDKYRSLLCQQ